MLSLHARVELSGAELDFCVCDYSNTLLSGEMLRNQFQVGGNHSLLAALFLPNSSLNFFGKELFMIMVIFVRLPGDRKALQPSVPQLVSTGR